MIAKVLPPGHPKAKCAPSRSRAVHEVTSVGAMFCRRAAPKAKCAPSGGSAVHEVTSVGAI